MADRRSLREKLAAMAAASESPHEAEIARQKLAQMGAGDREPPRRPPSAPGPAERYPEGWRERFEEEYQQAFRFTSSGSATTSTTNATGTHRFDSWARFRPRG